MSIWNYLFINQPAWISNVSNLTSITILGAVAGLYKRFNCDKQHCYRIGRHTVAGTTYHTCTKHLTAEVHSALQKKHARRYPQQTKFLSSSKG